MSTSLFKLAQTVKTQLNLHIRCLINGPHQVKKFLQTCAKWADSNHPVHVQSIIQTFVLYSYIFVVSNVSVSGEWWPWSVCVDAQADLGLHCPHMPQSITKTRLFEYIENFTTKNWKFSDKILIFFTYFCSKHRFGVLVRTASLRQF